MLELILLAAFLFLPAAPVFAQPRVMTLEEALAIAVEKNRDIEKARAYIAWAQGKYVEERAAAFPQLTASASLGWDRDESQKIYSPMQTERTERRSAQIGLTQPLFTWGQVRAAIRADPRLARLYGHVIGRESNETNCDERDDDG